MPDPEPKTLAGGRGAERRSQASPRAPRQDMTREPPAVARRRFLLATLGLGTALIATNGSAVSGIPTPRQSRGPFYPDRMPLDDDNDLTRIAHLEGTAAGEIAELSGRVLDLKGSPVAGAQVEIWQCDANGRYLHSRDRGRTARDPHFQGYGTTLTTGEGGYRFRTIKPVPYPGRAPHIHFAVTAPGRRPLITQLYVEGAPENARDWLRGRLSEAELQAVTVPFRPGSTPAGPLEAQFDLILG